MSTDATRIVNKLWSYCNVLTDDGLGYSDYLEQLTHLRFLKMAHEQWETSVRKTRMLGQDPPPRIVPEGYGWPSLDLSWLEDGSLLDAVNLRDPDEIAREIADDLTAALVQIEEILGDLQEGAAK